MQINHALRKYNIIVLVVLLFVLQEVKAQTEEMVFKSSRDELFEESQAWIPTLLTSSPSALYQLSTYAGYPLNWIPRGQAARSQLRIDGIDLYSKLPGWSASMTYAGLYKMFKQEMIAEQFSDHQKGFGSLYGTNYSSASAIPFKKMTQLSMRLANSLNVNETQLSISTGKLKGSWFAHAQVLMRNSALGVEPSGYKNVAGLAWSFDKELLHRQKISWTFWWDQIDQGRQSPSVKEAFDLSNQKNYNPNWGWYKGQRMYPNSKESNVPVNMFKYEKSWSSNKSLKLAVFFAIGAQKKSQLDWTQTADPRPDYYKYLPSYSRDSLVQMQLVKWYQSNPAALQINFDQLEKINKSSQTGRSYYVINTNVANVRLLKSAISYQVQLNDHCWWNVEANISKDEIHYFSQLKNLLGGSYFYNYNGWINEDGVANNFQNNLLEPDQKVKVGDRWGPNYKLHNFQMETATQLKLAGAKMEYTLGILYGYDHYYREGLNQNGLFPAISFGKSPLLIFPSYGAKAQILYKISGRIYARSVLYQSRPAPSAAAVYVDPAIHSFKTSFLSPQLQEGIDISLFYRGVPNKIQLNFYLQLKKQEAGHQMFYHDYYNAFVYGIYGQMESLYKGIELSYETELFGLFQLNATSTIGKYSINNAPLYEIRMVNDLFKVESGSMHLKDMPSSTSPQIVHAISLNYQPSYAFTTGLTAVYSMQRAIDIDFFRRTDRVMQLVQNNDTWLKIKSPTMLPDQLLVNFFMSKSFLIKIRGKDIQLRNTLSIKNSLNSHFPVFAFEPSRFDYKNLNVNKFPAKYIYDQGTFYALGIQLQIQ